MGTEVAISEDPASSGTAADGAGLVEVALVRGLAQTLTYRVKTPVPPGSRVRVPLGRRHATGVVVGRPEAAPEGVKTLRTATVLDAEPVIPAALLSLTRKVAAYYMTPWGTVLGAAMPPLPGAKPPPPRSLRTASLLVVPEKAAEEAMRLQERAPRQADVLIRLAAEGPLPVSKLSRDAVARLSGRGFVIVSEQEHRRVPLNAAAVSAPRPETLTDAQSHALNQVTGTFGGFSVQLLHGVTGSGKTEVYLQAAERLAESGRQTLLLTPEIALASHLTVAARARFGDGVAVLHSRLSDGERHDEWRRIRDDPEVVLVIGTRSAVFAPLERLGLVVVDEEHDGAYKQEETPRYHGRDVAIMRAQEAGVPVVLGSATPSMESFSKARRGDYLYLQLPDRVESRPLPGVELVDLREHRSVLPGGVVTEPLQKALAETLERGEQALLFVNRRGYAPMLLCPDCGHTWTCHHCQVSLTFHQKDRSIRCHYCDDRRLVPESCPDCGNIDLKPVGIGTQKLMQEVAQLFPQASLLRMDRDTTRAKNAHLDILKQVTDGHADVLIGTQMVAKGHNLPGVTLVGVVCADQGIHVPDFRAAEGVFSLLTQVAGRAGRGDRPGRVVLQTFDPEHPAIRCAVTHDYAGFAEVELAMRGAVGFPPAGRATRLLLRDRSPDRIEQAARVIAERVRHLPENGVTVLGPAPPLIAMLRDEHRLHLLIKGERAGPVRQVTRWLVDEIHKTPGLASVRLDIDVDPQNLM